MSLDTSKGAGLEGRYHVEKIDDPEGKHKDCRYFVLDPQHDKRARVALAHYAVSANDDGYEALANDIVAWLADLPHIFECSICGSDTHDSIGHGDG